jgi:hypothetical protein
VDNVRTHQAFREDLAGEPIDVNGLLRHETWVVIFAVESDFARSLTTYLIARKESGEESCTHARRNSQFFAMMKCTTELSTQIG